jgi:hypothetical protein
MSLAQHLTSGVCTSGIWEDTWIWYCDECQVHGVESDPSSAHDMAVFHSDRLNHVFEGPEEEEERLLDEEDMDEWYSRAVSLSSLSEEERDYLRIENDPMCDLYVISEKHNKAFKVDHWSQGAEAVRRGDYSDLEPDVVDLEKSNEIRKNLGLP